MNTFLRFCLLLIITIFARHSSAQGLIRIRADYTIKEKFNNESSLSKGTAYYDKILKKLVYNASFPEKEVWVLSDTVLFKFVDQKFIEKKTAPIIPEFSIYHITLNGNLPNYGLKDSHYKLESIEKEKDIIITTWKPDKKLPSVLGNVKMSTRNKRLEGIVFFNAKGDIISKQKFKGYTNIRGLDFPTEIMELIYTKEGVRYKQTIYKNIVVDEMTNEKMYDFSIAY